MQCNISHAIRTLITLKDNEMITDILKSRDTIKKVFDYLTLKNESMFISSTTFFRLLKYVLIKQCKEP